MSSTAQVSIFEAGAPERSPLSKELWLLTDLKGLLSAAQREWWTPGVEGLLLHRGELPPGWSWRAGAREGVAVALEVEDLRALDLDAGSQAGRARRALPMFAARRFVLASAEAAERLGVFLGQFSNISELGVPIEVVDDPGERALELPPASPERAPEEALRRWDSRRAAMSMALWSAPRIAPWLDLLVSLMSARGALSEQAASLGVPWLADRPWAPISELPDSWSAWLWRAGCEALGQLGVRGWGPERALADVIAVMESWEPGPELTQRMRRWQEHTQALLDAEQRVSVDAWRADPVGVAVQLVLLRPTPERFVSWSAAIPDIPPAVWLSGAILTGLIQGYPGLHKRFRGGAEARRILGLRAAPEALARSWRSHLRGEPRWRLREGHYEVLWGDQELDRRAERPRAGWYRVDLDEPAHAEAAMELAQRLGWREAVLTRLRLEDAELHFSGPGELTPVHDGELQVRGAMEVDVWGRASLHRRLVPEAFRRRLVTGRVARDLRAPPFERSRPMLLHSPAPVGWEASPEVPGLLYRPSFLNEAQQREVLQLVMAGEWRPDLKRRVQHYGWAYDYRARKIDHDMALGPLPDWAAHIARRLHDEGLLEHVPDQLIVNEYLGNQGITAHVDCAPCFEDGIAMISLVEAWEMVFRRKDQGKKVARRLDVGSALVMTEDARYLWTHEIPRRKREAGVDRERRVSLTFRRVRPPSAPHNGEA